MSQRAQPTEDVTTGSWTPTPVYEQVNDPHPGDGTFVSSPGTPDGDTFEVKLAEMGEPGSGEHVLTVRLRKVGPEERKVVVAVVQVPGPDEEPEAVIATREVPAEDLGEEFADFDVVLTEEEIEAITDYAVLRVRVTAYRPGSSSSSSGDSGGAGGSASSSSASASGSSSRSASASGSSGSMSASASGSASASESASASGSGSGAGPGSGSASGSAGGSQFSTGSASSSGVPVDCCPNILPRTFTLTISGGGGSFPLTWDGEKWRSGLVTIPGCGPAEFAFWCGGTGAGDFLLEALGGTSPSNPKCGIGDLGTLAATCDPFSFSVDGTFVGFGCDCVNETRTFTVTPGVLP